MKNHIQPKGQDEAATGNIRTHHHEINVSRKNWKEAYGAARQLSQNTYFQRTAARDIAAALAAFGGHVIAVELPKEFAS